MPRDHSVGEKAPRELGTRRQYSSQSLMPFRTPRTAPNSVPSRRPVAPIHRGPQAVSHSSVGNQTIHHAPNAALLIDFDNVTMGIRSDLQTELKNLLASDIIKGK